MIMPSRIALWLALTCLIGGFDHGVLAGSATNARTIVVALDGTGDFTSIQEAVDAAAKGDTVFLKAGRYEQDLTIHSKDHLKLVGAGQDKGRTSGPCPLHRSVWTALSGLA